MDTEDTVIDDCRKAEVIKNFGAILPDVHASILLEALVVKTVDLRDLSRLVVAANESDAVWIPYLHGPGQWHVEKKTLADMNH